MNINLPSSSPALNLPFVEQGSYSNKLARLPLAERLTDKQRNHFVACLGEFIGTFLFLFFALSGTHVANTAPGYAEEASRLQYISLCFGFSLAVNAWVWYRVSGGLFNPAVTVGMCLVAALPWMRGLFLIVAQLLGAVVAAAIVQAIFPGPLSVQTAVAEGTSAFQGFLIEMFLTFQLVITILMLAAEKHAATFIAPVGIGLSLFIAELSGVAITGGSLNPARSFAPDLVTGDFARHHWIYWAGPMSGSVMAAGVYKLLKILEYEKANPDQDASTTEAGASGEGGLRI